MQLVHVRPSTIPKELDLLRLETDQEHRAFHFFRSKTAPELASALQTTFWDSLILQVSHHDSTVRHAVVALGSLGERLQINNVLTLDNEEANKRHRFACTQYEKALQELRRQLSDNGEHSVEITLISCFLFICFEFLQGNDVGVLAHLRSGLNIVRCSEMTEKGNQMIYDLAACSDPGDFRSNTKELFGNLDGLAALWLGLRSLQRPVVNARQPYVPMPECFSSIDEVEKRLFGLIDEVYCLRDHANLQNQVILRQEDLQEINTQQLYLSSQLEQWLLSLESFLIRSGRELVIEDLHRVMIWRINRKVTSLMLDTTLEPIEEDFYRNQDSAFEEIVAFSISVLQPVNVMTNRKVFPTAQKIFSFTEGIIHPLYFTAVKCCNLSICRQAISLLSTSPWREGAWESASMAKIAEKQVSQLEKQGFYFRPDNRPLVFRPINSRGL